MSEVRPVSFTWSGTAMEPLPRYMPLCDRQFTVGERYTLVEHNDRSEASHGHYFAVLHKAWMNLPEDKASRFPDEEALRKWCLIKAGYYTVSRICCTSGNEAENLARAIRRIDPHSLVIVTDGVAEVYTAVSQSYKAMGKHKFNASKQSVLEICAEMIGVTVDELTRHSPVSAPLAGDAEPSPVGPSSGEGEAA